MYYIFLFCFFWELIKNVGKEDDVLHAVNHWYGRYSLPYTLKAEKNGKEVDDGYVIVLFKITAMNGSSNYLLYENQEVIGNQWVNEGGFADNVNINLPSITSNVGMKVSINVSDGYYPVIVYGYTPVGKPGSRLTYDTAGTH